MLLPAGSRLGPYELVSPIGAGGMGEVYRAVDKRLGRSVAVKILPENLSSQPERLHRFEKEARAASSLNHPNIVTIYDIGTFDSLSYIAMELVEGKNVRELINTGPVPLRRLFSIGAQLTDGLAKAHEAGIVHRDLKPENLMVTRDGLLKILDFGLAKLTRPGSESERDVESGLATMTGGTEPGVVMGTAGYMSPEQASGRPLDFRSDQFSVGSILYEMATGTRAFDRPTPVQTMSAIIQDEPASLTVTNPKLPANFCWIVERCLAKEAEQRYSATRDLAHDLAMLRDHATEISTPSAMVSKPLRRRAWRWALPTVAGLGLMVGLAAVIWRGEKSAKTVGPVRSLAVLPLQNLSGDPEQEYFADGMTEELITDLSRIGGLRIVSRTSMMQYRGTKKPVPQIAKELNVDAVVEGSVARSGNRITIQAHLIEAATDRSLWGERYERDLADIPAVQSEAARAIAKKIRVKLSPQEEERLASARPVNAEAYELYLRGRSALDSFTSPQTALRLFEQATVLDPAYARAYAGIARVYLRGHTGVAPEIARTRAEQATERALSLDESLPEAHVAAAGIRKAALDWVGTEREYRRAIGLDPNSVEARVEYGLWLSALARHAEALDQVRHANSLDPLSPYAGWAVATVLRFARRYDEAIAQAQKVLALYPNDVPAHRTLGLCYSAKEKFDQAIAEFLRSGRPSGNLGQTYALAGRTREARKLLADFEAGYKQTGAGVFDIAQIYVGLGDNDRAFEWLARMSPPSEQFTFKVAEIWDPLRSDPRFARLLERWRLTDAQIRPPAPGQEPR